VAVPVGLAMASLAASLALYPHQGRLPAWYFEAAPTLAKGLNLVNVVLVDFRGIDTAIETLVVLLASLGVVGLLLGREVPDPADRDGGSR
jgi:multicomponent Na+:H+ antiporter subunit A